ncbi:MAG: hypothetical protein DRJ34_00460 [Thermoprotei archaeon]|nr:MAG: hypothetical protein DRJ34_00460 [Thermoprotei archaeon]
MTEKWIDVDTAKKVLKNSCDFLKEDEIADFKIINGKEAILLSIYTGAFFLINEKYKFGFRPTLGAWSPKESLCIMPIQEEIWTISEIIPIFGLSLSFYFQFFPTLSKPKYLFIINAREYSRRKYDYSGRFYYELRDGSKIIKDVLNKIKLNNINPQDCLVWISNPNGTFGEDFWKYVSGVILREKGYFITYYGMGDLSAYYIPEYLKEMVDRGFLKRGAFIEELEMLEKTTPKYFKSIKSNYESIVIEAESSDIRVRSHSKKAGVGQIIEKYLGYESGNNYGIVTGPFCTTYTDIHCQNDKCLCKSIGLISCDENGNPIFLEPKRENVVQLERKIEIIKTLIKCSLLRNLSFKERCELMETRPTNLIDYLEKILSIDIATILDKIEEKYYAT